MDIEFIKQGLGTITMVLTALKQAKDLLPDGAKKKQISDAVEQAERQFKMAEAKMAQGMGYQLCRNHKLPEIMLSKDNLNWRCPECGNEIQYKEPSGNPMN